MATSSPANPAPAAADEAIWSARQLLRRGLKASLATLGHPSGHPFASLVSVALSPDGTPVTLISRLAVHTQNLLADPRASLLFDGTTGLADPLTGGRLTTVGQAEKLALGTPAHASARDRFLARHPSAQIYVDFADFSFWTFKIERAHLVGGFGRIRELPGKDLMLDTSGAASLLAAEPEIIAHMNADHADAVALYATRLLSAPAGNWRFAGIDPAGADLILGDAALRLDFPEPIGSPADARKMLAELAEKARS